MRFLHNVLGVGNKVSHGVVREEAGSPAYALDDITLMLSGCRKCWGYKVLAFAYREDIYEGNADRFNPDDQCPDGARQEYPGRVMGIESQQT